MTQEDFEQQLRALLRRRPFLPFAVVLLNGERIEVDAAEAVAMGGGTGGYLSPEGDATFFDCENVSQFITHTPETAS